MLRTNNRFSRQNLDRLAGVVFRAGMAFPLLAIIAITIALAWRALPVIHLQSIWQLLFGLDWHPMEQKFGFAPFILGTLWVTLLAMLLALPPALLTAIYLAEYASVTMRSFTKPLLDILAGIPSVVYGVWGVVFIVPWIRETAVPLANRWLSFLPVLTPPRIPTGFSILAAGIVLAVMVLPVIVAVTYEVLISVPNGLREASLALGATQWYTTRRVVLRRAASGILAGVILGFSRAFGETMAVLMVVGNVANRPSSIFEPAYPLTALIANNYGEMLSIPLYDAALMGAALILLLVVLTFNLIAAFSLRRILKRSLQ